jgi:hypothetical protein
MDEVLQAMKDLERCQEIVGQARIALVDSQMFDYSQLVGTACGGLLSAQGGDCAQWNDFAEFLRFSRLAQELAPELHDAVMYALQSDSDFVSDTSPGVSHISRILDELSLEEWFQSIKDAASSDLIGIRAPWIWRAL